VLARTTYEKSIALYQHHGYCVIGAYHEDGRYGYFICKENVKSEQNRTVYVYSDVRDFIHRTSNDSFQIALSLLGNV